MKITIGYLYSDLMNLYGDIGNIKVLGYHLKEQKINFDIKYVSIGDDINFNDYDLLYIGSGTEDARDIVLNDLLKYKDEIKNYIENEKYILATGNSYPLFGEYIIDKENNKKEALNIFPYYEIKTSRVVMDASLKNNLVSKDIYGFYNHFNDVLNNEKPLFEKEGYCYKNFYGTYLLGPILARNPMLLTLFLKKFILSIKPNYKIRKFNVKYNSKAYDEFIIFKQTKKHIK